MSNKRPHRRRLEFSLECLRCRSQ
ncbi:hypothetical protein D049_3768A, partial [Vibrio parahaemolyticus VPTS-2010]